ncbi:toll/interleukin-1 receptor domain-containing protein [Umezawaea sp. Da 62-37]|uniref:toll/interleukin-1 receptor domain-containing protein n=1 Tax=Umezawaea sp. Da 62-37 TaxID=3075927 RepID=UPI0028F72220|nr:toll/interleukin-1 receptor domain-containing protein [Umezawaea sp. Da 62-37]WNV83498.1 toll/interleukin-1 receptor domain-containing protein [Umezawaea sp. Da 62-37]
MASNGVKHVFVSYVREDNDQVDKLCDALEAAQIPYWRDRTALAPGDAWKQRIREAIRSGTLVFLACFSEQSRAKAKSYMNEEITLAAEEFRQLAPGSTWLIPVRFDDGDVPEWELGAGRMLSDLNYADLFGEKYVSNLVALMSTIAKAMGAPGPSAMTVQASIEEADATDRPVLLRRMTKEMILDPEKRIQLDDLISHETQRVLQAMRDEKRFPLQRLEGTTVEQVVQCANVVSSYCRLISPLCASLQVAVRWGEIQTLTPWASALKAIAREAMKPKNGVSGLIELQHVPALLGTFTVALAAVGQGRWDNLKALLIDVMLPAKYGDGLDHLIQIENPWAPFGSLNDLVPNVVARAAKTDEDPFAAFDAFTENRVGKYKTPVADWLHAVLRSHFADQFADDSDYDDAFDRTEVALGVLSQDLDNVRAASLGNTRSGRSYWFGRSTWRANYGTGAAGVMAAEIEVGGLLWPPLSAGLFGGQLDRATVAAKNYVEQFGQMRRFY